MLWGDVTGAPYLTQRQEHRVYPSLLTGLRTPDHNVETCYLGQRGCVPLASTTSKSDAQSQSIRDISFNMALEGIAALNFAGNIIQFIDIGVRLFSKSRRLYKSHNGVLLESAELETIATSIKKLSEHLTANPPPQHQRSLENSGLTLLALGCNTIAEELLSALAKLKIRGSESRKWQSFRIALSMIWKSEDIEDMAKRLDLLSKQLTTCMVYTLQ